MDPTKRAAAIGLGALAAEAALSALLVRAGFGPLPLLVMNAIGVAFAVLVLIDRSASVFDEVGLGRPAYRGIPIGLAMAAPLAITLLVTRESAPIVAPLHLVRLALATALADELLYRGFALRLLVRRAKWGALPAIIATVVAVMLARVLASVGSATTGDIIQAAILGGATQAWFGWLFTAWDEDLWVPLALHFGLNLAWSAFEGAASTENGRPWSHVGRLAAFAASIALTVALRRLRRPPVAAS